MDGTSMLRWLTRKTARQTTARELYGSIVTAARTEVFYADWGVPDTPEGRLEVLLLHLVLVLDRLDAAGETTEPLRRALTETFVVDMDDNLREMGVGDLAVPRRVKKAAAALYDRHRDYAAALAAPDDEMLRSALSAACATTDAPPDVDNLAAYVRRQASRLASQRTEELIAGRMNFGAATAGGQP